VSCADTFPSLDLVPVLEGEDLEQPHDLAAFMSVGESRRIEPKSARSFLFTLSRPEHGFDSRWGRQPRNAILVSCI
jgi:hypothetical protein